jgi:hypothetical protein
MTTRDEREQATARDRYLAVTGRPDPQYLGAALRDHAFARAGCHLIHPEVVMAARQRGSAAECAEDAWLALRRGQVAEARDLLLAALRYLDDYAKATR